MKRGMLRAWSYTEPTECEKEPAGDGFEKLIRTDAERSDFVTKALLKHVSW